MAPQLDAITDYCICTYTITMAPFLPLNNPLTMNEQGLPVLQNMHSIAQISMYITEADFKLSTLLREKIAVEGRQSTWRNTGYL